MTAKPAASDPPHPKGTLFRTREGDLDFGWVILIFCVIVGMGSFILEGFGLMRLSNAGWIWFGSFTTMSFLAGAAIARARLIAKADVSAAQARAIDAVVEQDPKAAVALAADKVPAIPTEPNLFTDDERG
jgi:hypothetical protein